MNQLQLEIGLLEKEILVEKQALAAANAAIPVSAGVVAACTARIVAA